MALKSDRNELQTDISFFMNETATRGGVVSMLATAGSWCCYGSRRCFGYIHCCFW